MSKFNVWGVPESADLACIVLAEFDDEAEAERDAESRNVSAEKHGLSMTYVYLPDGDEPVF